MRALFFVIAGCMLSAQVLAGGLSSEDYQAGIREATERYRGDGTERLNMIISEEYYARSKSQEVAPPFQSQPFTLRNTLQVDHSDTASLELRRVIPNHFGTPQTLRDD